MITFVSTARAPKDFILRCLQSVQDQTLPARHIYLVDEDNGAVAEALRYLGNNHPHVEIRPGFGTSLEGLFETIHELPPSTVVAWLDGDDFLVNPRTVEIVQRAYARGAWCTYGQFVHYSHAFPGAKGWVQPYPEDVLREGRVREVPFYASHLKTFYAGLFQRIRVDDFFSDQGTWVTECTDLAIMFPILEMARERSQFIPDVLVGYRHDNPESTHNIGGERLAYQTSEAQRIRALRRYSKVEVMPW